MGMCAAAMERSKISAQLAQGCVLWVLLVACVSGEEESAASLDHDSKKVAVKIWGHTDGGPRPHQIELHLPDGQAADVAELVARKKVEVASAELHHARVKEKQLKQVYDEARERDLAAHTKQKLAEKQYQRASKDHSRTAKALSIAKSKQAKALEKTMERNQALQFASKKKKAKMADGVKLAQRAKAAAETAVDTATGKAAKASDKLRDASRTKK